MRRGASFSATLHLVVVLLAYFGLPSLFAPDAPIERPIPVTIYTVRDETVLPPPEPEPKAEPEKEPAPMPPEPEVAEDFVPAPPEPTFAPPDPPAEPLPRVTEAAEPPPPPPEIAPPSAVPPPPKPVHVAKVEPPPKPEPKPEKKPEKKVEPPPDPFASLLKSVEEFARQAPLIEQKTAEAKAAEPPPLTAPVSSVSDEPLSVSVLDAIRRQVEDNWSLPAGAREASGLEVEIRILLMPDGTVREARVVDLARLEREGEGFFRSMAESAMRAVQRSSPLHDLPPEKYEQWREITFRFRPPV